MIYRHKVTGEYLQLLNKRESNINTYLQVDVFGNAIVKKREWSVKEEEQIKIVKGFNNLIKVSKKIKT